MTSCKNVTRFVLVVLLFSLPLFGQYSSTTSQVAADVLNSTYAPATHFGYNCVSKSCWTLLYSTGMPAVQQVAVTTEGAVEAIDTSGNRWTWYQQQWSEITTDPFKFKKLFLSSKLVTNTTLAIATNGLAYFEGSAGFTQLGTRTFTDGAIDRAGNAYGISAGNVWWWNGTTWIEVRAAGDAVAIAADTVSVVIINSSGNLYAAGAAGGTTWTQFAGLGFTPSTAAGSVGMSDDASFSILDSAGQLHVSHDGGSTFSAVNMDGFTVSSTTNTGVDTTFVVAGGYIEHLNTLVNVSQIQITGSCGTACGTGNPAVSVLMAAAPAVGCPAGWTTYAVGGGQDPYCGLVANANDVLNATPLSLFSSCDGFAPGDQPSCATYKLSISVTLVLGGSVFASGQTECECEFQPATANQKYYVTTNNYSQAATYFGLFGVFGNYQWKNTGLEQFCTNSPLIPNLQPFGPNVRILYHAKPPKSTNMPGRYVNGDVAFVVNPSTGHWMIQLVGAAWSAPGPTLIVWQYAWVAVGEPITYTWNDTDTQLRGPGGQPTIPCMGQ